MERHPATDTSSEKAEGYSAREMAERAGVTVRTIHYYTSEGLLPPPEGTTRGATYSAAHLARLRIIAALRDEGLALGRIRERLAPLTDAQALHVGEALDQHLATGDTSPLTSLGLIDLELTRQNLPDVAQHVSHDVAEEFDVQTMTAFAPPSVPAPLAQRTGSAREYLDRLLRRDETTMPAPSSAKRMPRQPDWTQPPAEPPEVWYQFQIDDGIELRLREDRYRQAKGRPAALIDTLRMHLRRYGLLHTTHDQEDDPTDL